MKPVCGPAERKRATRLRFLKPFDAERVMVFRARNSIPRDDAPRKHNIGPIGRSLLNAAEN